VLQQEVEATVQQLVDGNVQNKVATNKTLWTIADNTEMNSEYVDEKKKIESVIKQCHNLLYDACSIVGTKAQNDIMRLLCLRILKAQFNDDTSELWASCVAVKADQNLSDTKFNKYMKYCKDMKTLTHPDLDFFKEWRFLVRDLLKYALPSVYGEEDERFNCDNYTVCIKMIEKMENDIPSSKAFSDAFSTTCGDIHEMFRAYGGGKAAKELGQFFTTRELIHATFHGLDLPELLKHNHKVSVYDPCMGTGGFLTRMFNLFEVDPDNIYGCETESDTIKFGQMSLVLTTGKVGNNIVKCNSISENPLLVGTKKMDAIVTNPPFGTKMKYADLKKTFEETFPDTSVKFKDIYPINTSNGACLFIQHCVYMLAHGGMCALVLPDGELFDSHSKWSAKFRKWWCENVNIRTILKVPAGVFKHAGVRTNVVVFTKDGPTTSIDYKELTDKTCTSINELFSVDVADIVQMGYNLDYKTYLKEEGNVYDVPMVALGDVCTLEKGKTLKKSDFETSGSIPVIGGGRQPTGTHNESNRPPNTILLSSSGSYAGYVSRYTTPVWASDCFSIRPTNETLNEDYLYHVLRQNQQRIYDLRPPSAGQPHLYAKNLEPYKIPLPPLQTQHQIVQELETIETSIQTLCTRVGQLKREKELFHKYGRKGELTGLWEGCEWRKLGEVCTLEKGTQQSSKVVEDPDGEARMITLSPFIGKYKKIKAFQVNDKCLFVGNIDAGSRSNPLFRVNYFEGKCDWINIVSRCNVDQSKVHPKFLYYFLCTQQEVLTQDYLKGSANLSLNKPKFLSLKIPIPTPAIQTQSIAIFEAKAKHIQTLDESIQREEQHIKDLQQLGKDVIASFCCTKE
jgi:type I restriction enzyme S subunit